MFEHEFKIKCRLVRGIVTSLCIQVSGTLEAQFWVQYLHCYWSPFSTVMSLICNKGQYYLSTGSWCKEMNDSKLRFLWQ